MQRKKAFMIGNAHLDPAWVWSWQEGSCETKATIRSALDRMREFPDFKFVCSSASVYQWVQDFDADMFEELKTCVKEGRFIIVGGWNVQPDCNLPSGEHFARMSLYSQRYFKETFGKTSLVGYNVDSFGHNAMMPQILQKSGMKYYVYMRPMDYEKTMPANVFTWESPDDSKVTAFRIYEAYCKRFNTLEELETYLDNCSNFYNGTDFMGYYGVGNHGGGPTIKNIQLIEEYNKKTDRKYDLKMANPVEFFEKIEAENELPVVKDELQHHASGCYSAVSEVKTLLRKGSTKLSSAENYSVLTEILTGKPYDTDKMKVGWENLNFLAFHDILGGCCVKSVYDDSLYMGYEAISIAEKQKNSALQTLSWKIDTTNKEHGLPIIVFNPHAFDVEETVMINNHVTAVKDANGNELPFENAVSEALTVFERDNAIFRAKVPALGYAVYYYEPSDEFNKVFRSKGDYSQRAKLCQDICLENDILKVAFDDKGNVSSIFDKRTGREVLEKPSRSIIIDENEHDTWSHGKNHFNKEIGEFELISIEKLESNVIRETVKVCLSYGKSELTQYYTLHKGESFVRVKAKLNWNEKHKMLKFAFPIKTDAPTSLYEIPFGTLERPCNGEEEPALNWAMVGDNGNGLAVLNDSKYSYSANGNEIALTGIRSPIYCDHGLKRSTESNYTDQGICEFTYALMPATTKDVASVTKRALQLNTPLTAIMENHHNGTLPTTYQGIAINQENIVLSAFKKAEDGDGFVIRAYECAGKAVSCEINCMKLGCFSVDFTPFEAKTLRIQNGKIKEVLFTEYDLND